MAGPTEVVVVPTTLTNARVMDLCRQCKGHPEVALDLGDFSYASPLVEPLAVQAVMSLTRQQRVAVAGLPGWASQPASSWPQGAAVVLAGLAAHAISSRATSSNIRAMIGADLSVEEIVTPSTTVRFLTYSSLRQQGWKAQDRWGRGAGLRLALTPYLADRRVVIGDQLGNLSVMVAEAIQNVVKWATRSVGGEAVTGRMMVSLSRSTIRDLAILHDDLEMSHGEYLQWYLRQGGNSNDPVILASIVDIGDGVAATFEGRDVRDLPGAVELHILSKAMLPGSATSRRAGEPQTGFGFRNMMSSVVACRGAIQMRTGKQLGLFFDRAGAQSMNTSLFSQNWEFEDAAEFGYGTSLTAVIPFPRPAELFP